MNILKSVNEKIAKAILSPVSPAKFIEKKAIPQKGAPSIAEACQSFRYAYESMMPLSLKNVEKTNELLKALKAKGGYKKIKV